MKLMPQSLRARLTVWFALTLALLLAGSFAGIYLWLKHNLVARIDFHLHENFEIAEELLEEVSPGKIGWKTQPHQLEEGEPWAESWWAEVWSPNGTLLYSTKPEKSVPPIDAARCLRARYSWQTIETQDGGYRTLCGAHTIGNTSALIRVLQPETPLRHELAALLLIMGMVLPLAVAFSGFGGYALARRALAPIETMSRRARQISAEQLSERLPVGNPNDELGALAATFNDMFARLERSFEQMRRFSADASHELRTPLTVLRSLGEVSLKGPQDPKVYREVISSMLEEVDQMRQLIDSLLTLSRADAGHLRMKAQSEDLLKIAEEAVAQLEVLAEEKQQTLRIVHDGPVRGLVDRGVFRQALINFVDNAIKYSPPRSEIRVVLSSKDGESRIEVSDSGPGIAREHQSKIFDRFYRVDASRSREAGGFGLGLSIARWAVEANGGKIELESEEGRGSTFRVIVPS